MKLTMPCSFPTRTCTVQDTRLTFSPPTAATSAMPNSVATNRRAIAGASAATTLVRVPDFGQRGVENGLDAHPEFPSAGATAGVPEIRLDVVLRLALVDVEVVAGRCEFEEVELHDT